MEQLEDNYCYNKNKTKVSGAYNQVKMKEFGVVNKERVVGYKSCKILCKFGFSKKLYINRRIILKSENQKQPI